MKKVLTVLFIVLMATTLTAQVTRRVPRENIAGTTAPTVNNDVSQGYSVGSKWNDVTADERYVCLDSTDGAAVWIKSATLGTLVLTQLDVSNAGIHMLDTDASHDLIWTASSNLTADRTLAFDIGDVDREIVLTGNATLNQDVSTAGAPGFATGVTVGNLTLADGNITDSGGTIDFPVAATFGDGGTTNYISFVADGFLALNGTARASEDMQFEVVDLQVGSSAPTAAITGVTPVLLFDTTTDDEAHLVVEVPHTYDNGTDLLAHFHWAPVDGNTGDVTWGIEYHISRDDNNEVLTEATTTMIVVDATQSLQDEILSSGNIVISGSGVQSEDHIHIRIFRDADASEAGASDTYASDAALISFDIEYMIDGFGEDVQF